MQKLLQQSATYPLFKRTKKARRSGNLPAAACGLLMALGVMLLALYPTGQARAATTTINVCAQDATNGWNLLSSQMAYLRAKLDNPANFGPSGTYGDFDFNYIDIGTNVTEATLLSNACNIWFSGYEHDTQYTPAELAELSNWVANTDGQVFAGCDASSNDPVCDLLGFTVTNDTDSYGFVKQQVINPITCDGVLTPDDQLEMSGGAGAYFTGPGVTPTNVIAVHETGGVADPAKPIIAYTGDFFLTSDIDMVSTYTLTSGGGVSNNNDIMAVNAFSALADVSVGNPICSSAGPQVADLTITKATNPAGGTDFPFVLDPDDNSHFLTKWGSAGSSNSQFDTPYGVAVDGSGNVYVADTDNHRIQKFDADGGYQTEWGSNGAGNGQFQYPGGVAVDGSGNVYVTDTNNNRIQKFAGDGTFLMAFGWDVVSGNVDTDFEICQSGDTCKDGLPGSGDGQFSYPYGVAVDGAGNVYVADTYNHRIQKFDSSGAYQDQWGILGNLDGRFYNPAGVAVDGSGNVYVADTLNHRIQKFGGNGNWQATWGGPVSGSGNGQFNAPIGVAVDGSGNVYVADTNNYRIQKFDAGGVYQTQWGSNGAGNSQFSFPIGVAVDGAANVYVADTYNHRVQKFGPVSVTLDDGESHTFPGLPAGDHEVAELVPGGWTLDDIDCGNATATRTDDSISVTLVAGVDVTCVFTNTQLGSLTITKATNPAGGTDFPFVLDPDNIGFLAQWGSPGSGNSQFDSPTGVAVDGNGNVYVAEYYNHRIQKFGAGGAYVGQWGGNGSGNGQLFYPIGVDVDGSGNVYVADSGNNRIQKFAGDGTFLMAFGWDVVSGNVDTDFEICQPGDTCQDGSSGSGNGQFSDPRGVAVDGAGNVYVADSGNHRIQKFDAGGAYVGQWGSGGSSNGQFNYPAGVAVDGSGNVYVADSDNHRIQKFDSNGNYQSKWGVSGNGNGQFQYPQAVAADGVGNVYVADSDNSRIQKFDAGGVYQTQWGSFGSGNGQFQYPTGVAVDGSSNVYVADFYDNRIQKFGPASVTLDDGQSHTFPGLPAGDHEVAELVPDGWTLDDIDCGSATATRTDDTISVTLAAGDDVTCTFTNVYTPQVTNICPVDAMSSQWTDILGAGMGNPKTHKVSVKVNIPNYTQVTSLYGQMVAKDPGKAKYVRFILPGANNYVQVNSVTSPIDHAFGNFWYGDYIDPAKLPAKSVTGQWFLQASGTKGHIPRALVLYPTYNDPNKTYVNIWNTYDAAEAEVYWDTAAGWTQTRVITESIAPPNGPTTFNVELALADNDKDARQVWVTVEAGGVSVTQKPKNPNKGDQLNLMTFTLKNVPAGTDTITITLYSPSKALDRVEGDSAALVGMRANYVCAPLTQVP
ncbi:MAG: hypothetical protein KBF17_10020 [Candidatus Promineofilum sp.]|nr:hypothetical protein [Promineifilum sp.]